MGLLADNIGILSSNNGNNSGNNRNNTTVFVKEDRGGDCRPRKNNCHKSHKPKCKPRPHCD